jgi:hypothetical protein
MVTYKNKAAADTSVEASYDTVAAEAVWDVRGDMMGPFKNLDQSPSYCSPSTYFINSR